MHSLATEQCLTHALQQKSVPVNEAQRVSLKEQFKDLLVRNRAVLVAHYYVEEDVQVLADETGGCVADSLEMARFGRDHPARTLVVAGVKFMGETAKILSPSKRVLMPTMDATCSLDLDCPADAFRVFREQYPDREVVVYANTSAAVKAQADWVVTSSIALDVVAHLHAQGRKVLWAPDKYLGQYVQKKTGADMVLWDGSCVVHEEFKLQGIEMLKQQYPEAGLLVHPESPGPVVDMADVVGSTTQLVKAAQTLPNPVFIVATDKGLFYKLKQVAPDKTFLIAPTGGTGGTCKSCAHCPWMAMNELNRLVTVFDQTDNEVLIDSALGERALMPLQRMLEFVKEQPARV